MIGQELPDFRLAGQAEQGGIKPWLRIFARLALAHKPMSPVTRFCQPIRIAVAQVTQIRLGILAQPVMRDPSTVHTFCPADHLRPVPVIPRFHRLQCNRHPPPETTALSQQEPEAPTPHPPCAIDSRNQTGTLARWLISPPRAP
jgi:hypothetical protein